MEKNVLKIISGGKGRFSRLKKIFSAALIFSGGVFFAAAQEASSTVAEVSSPEAASSVSENKDYLSMPEYSRLSSLLTGWLSNDLELKKAVLEAQSKALSLKTAQISNGFDITLSSGSVSVRTDTSNNTTVSFYPSVSVDLPMVQGASVDFDLPYTVKDGQSYVSDGSLSASIGIIDGTSKQRKVTLLEAQRSLTEAQRSVTDRALKAEKEFYESLKKLYNYAVSIHTLKSELYDDEVDLRVLETKGYSKTSASYRQAALKVESDRRDVLEKQRLLERETAVFALKCGTEFTRTSGDNDRSVKAGDESYEAVLAFLPDKVPFVNDVKIFDYRQEDYVSVESASWDKYIGQLKREADYDMTLKATGEYIFNSLVSEYDDAGGKLSFSWKGVSASAGAYVPTGRNTLPQNELYKSFKNDNPYFQFSLAINPNEWRLSKIEKEQDKIDSQKEEIAVQSAYDEYESSVLEKVSTFHDIKWSQASYAEEYDMYTKLEQDMAKWLEQGIVTENDYLDALNNREKARINTMINAVDLLIFNDEVRLLFHDAKQADGKTEDTVTGGGKLNEKKTGNKSK